MNWAMTAVICSILIAIGSGLAKLINSLVQSYFHTLSKRMDGFEKSLSDHVTAEQAYQGRVTEMLASMRDSLIRLDQGKEQYLTLGTHLEAMRTIDANISASRHASRNEFQAVLSKHEVEAQVEFNEIRRRVEKLEDV